MSARKRGLIVGILLAAMTARRRQLIARLADGRGVAETACARLLPAVDHVVAVVPAQPGALEDTLRAAAPRWCAATRRPGIGVSIAQAAWLPAPRPLAGWSRSATCLWY